MTPEERNTLLNERFQAFVQSIAHSAGETPVGAMAVFCWVSDDRDERKQDHASVSVTIANAAPVVQMRIVDILMKKIMQAAGHIKAQINTRRIDA
jgi:hypothetical protein